MSGGFASLPGGMNHYAWATARRDRASAQERRIRDRLWVNPADDAKQAHGRLAQDITPAAITLSGRRVLVGFLAIEY
jgi:hypothetical protein